MSAELPELAVELLLEELLADAAGFAADLVVVLVWPEPNVTKAAKPKTTNIAADRIRFLLIRILPFLLVSLTAGLREPRFVEHARLGRIGRDCMSKFLTLSRAKKSACPFSKALAGCGPQLGKRLSVRLNTTEIT